jgi:hypothetical protein
MLSSREEIDALAAAMGRSAERLQTLWFTFLAVTLYFAISAFTTTHRMLLLVVRADFADTGREAAATTLLYNCARVLRRQASASGFSRSLPCASDRALSAARGRRPIVAHA